MASRAGGDRRFGQPGALRAGRRAPAGHALGLTHRLVHTSEVEDERYASNPVDRCYFCKTHLYTELEQLAAETGARFILNGLNVDDLGDWRPVRARAAERAGPCPQSAPRSGHGQGRIRQAARELGLPNWDKPALACLSSRLPYGERVTPEKLERVGRAEASFARARLPPAAGPPFRRSSARRDRPRRVGARPSRRPAPRIEADLLALGFPAVEIDPRGYRSGRLNEGVVPLVNGARSAPVISG